MMMIAHGWSRTKRRRALLPATKRLPGTPSAVVPPPPMRDIEKDARSKPPLRLATDHMNPTSSRAVAAAGKEKQRPAARLHAIARLPRDQRWRNYGPRGRVIGSTDKGHSQSDRPRRNAHDPAGESSGACWSATRRAHRRSEPLLPGLLPQALCRSSASRCGF